jgi:hypothetical protein
MLIPRHTQAEAAGIPMALEGWNILEAIPTLIISHLCSGNVAEGRNNIVSPLPRFAAHTLCYYVFTGTRIVLIPPFPNVKTLPTTSISRTLPFDCGDPTGKTHNFGARVTHLGTPPFLVVYMCARCGYSNSAEQREVAWFVVA